MPSTVKKTVKLIVENGNYYLIPVKGNQPKLLATLEAAFEQNPALSIELEYEKAHGRLVKRKVTVLLPPADIDEEWMNVQRIIKVERSGTRGHKPFKETIYYISSLTCEAKDFARLIRCHWHIENRLHWPKDAVLKEDIIATCAGRAIQGFGILRTIVVNLLRASGFNSITEGLDRMAHDINRLFSLLN